MKRRHFLQASAAATIGFLGKDLIAMTHSTEKNKQRSIYKIMNSSAGGMGKMSLKNIIQGDYQNYVSPFFLLDEFGPMNLPAGAPFRVDAHPHAGIIPTTYLLSGDAHHRDSLDNDFIYKKGDFIQFTSGKGALHMEETGDDLYKNGGVFHGIQGWLNIPSHLKKSEPYAEFIANENIVSTNGEGFSIKVILGEVLGAKAKTKLLMPVIYWHVTLESNTTLNLPIPADQNSFLYLLNGEVYTQDTLLTAGTTVLFERDGDSITLKSKTKTELLILGGQVNNERYVAGGPFVVNSEDELMKAYNDFEQGKFGDLERTNGVRR